jgi:hypothetical protein
LQTYRCPRTPDIDVPGLRARQGADGRIHRVKIIGHTDYDLIAELI